MGATRQDSKRAIPASLDTEILGKAGDGWSSQKIASWLEQEHGLKVSYKSVLRCLERVRAEREPAARAVAAGKLADKLTTDLDGVDAQLERARKNEVASGDLSKVIAELSRVAYADPGRAMDAQGQHLDLQGIPEDLRRSISSYEVEVQHAASPEGSGDAEVATQTRLVKVKFWDKNKALAELIKVRGQYAERSTQLAAMAHQLKLWELRFRLAGLGGNNAEDPAAITARIEKRIAEIEAQDKEADG